jgi:hypothetical protein
MLPHQSNFWTWWNDNRQIIKWHINCIFFYNKKSHICSHIFSLRIFKFFFPFLPFNTKTLFSSCWSKICYIIIKFSSVIGFPHWARNITLTYPYLLFVLNKMHINIFQKLYNTECENLFRKYFSGKIYIKS